MPVSIDNLPSHKQWLIQSHAQDSDQDGYMPARRMTYSPVSLSRAIISVLVLFMGILPVTTHAGVFSFLFRTKNTPSHTHTITPNINSQTMPLLSAAVNADPAPSKGGGDITVTADNALLPSAGPAGSLADLPGSESKTKKHTDIYVVREGDTLSTIASLFGVSVSTIRAANDLTRSSIIRPGQELTILPVTGVQYTVKRGGTLRDIVAHYSKGAHTKEILAEAAQFNDIDPDEWLKKGTTVIIPDAEPQLQNSSTPWRDTRKYSRRVVHARAHRNLPSYSGYYMRPVRGGVKTQGIHGYNAVDIGIPVGTAVVAAAPGTVVRAKYSGWNYGYGHYVMIAHPNGTKTLYAHLSQTLVAKGQKVVRGQLIGRSGNTGHSTGPHLHFEVRGARNPF